MKTQEVSADIAVTEKNEKQVRQIIRGTQEEFQIKLPQILMVLLINQ